MPILRMRDVSYVARGSIMVPPTTLDVEHGERVTRAMGTASAAEALAMMAAALVRPTSGTIQIGEYDPRVQPVHCKRLVGFVPHDPLPLKDMGFDRYIDYRAALWDIDIERAREHAATLLKRLGSLHEAFAYPVVGALVANPELLVLDRPHASTRDAIVAAAGSCAILELNLT